MARNPDGGQAETAILSGGPMDGREHPVEGDTGELSVVMSDGQRHRYVRTEDVHNLRDGRSAVVFGWRGRTYGSE
jgi:hypothetical protein